MQATNAPYSSSGQFVDKTDLAPGTKWTATDANAWQAELLECITEAGLVPNGGDLTQLRQAIQALAKLVKVNESNEADHADAATNATNATKHNGLKVKSLDIGDWNMNTLAAKSLEHGLTLSKIRYVEVMIRNDAGDNLRPLIDYLGSGAVSISSTIISLVRAEASYFNSTDYESGTPFNRGFITIFYVE